MGAEAGQAANGVELRQRGQLATVDARVRVLQAAPGGGGHPSVEGVECSCVAAMLVGCGTQGVGQSWRAVVKMAVVSGQDFAASGGREPVVGTLPWSKTSAGTFDVQ
ncbi:hypothetical protein Pa4123_62130 [Phytohabitans aurantiacus]|uniref:Uncharacterized protein n=1 Tax=Phytohabitans aurantiacus TaxID=3016789 RepID=A0ABQ5R424_9ACTN|nr:hypothetical protein Pa4123_62130 [Phytohabitans aurantiacus]